MQGGFLIPIKQGCDEAEQGKAEAKLVVHDDIVTIADGDSDND